MESEDVSQIAFAQLEVKFYQDVIIVLQMQIPINANIN